MVALWIILIILCVMLLLLLVPISVNFKYGNGETTLIVSYFFIKFKLLPKSEKAKIKEQKKKNKKSDQKDNDEQKKPTFLDKVTEDFKQNHDLSTKINIILKALKQLLRRVKQLLKFLKISRFDLNVKISSSDAAETALNYGRFNGAFYTLLGFITPLFRWGKRRVVIDPDFTHEKSRVFADIKVRGSLMPFLVIAILLYRDCKKL